MTRPAAFAAAALVVAAAAAACSPAIEAPTDKGVCWHMVRGAKGQKPTYHKVAENVPNLESCALDLEAMRTRFLRMGGSRLTIDGAYQGAFIFIERQGVFSSPSLDGAAYIALPRAADGGLLVRGGPAPTPADPMAPAPVPAPAGGPGR